MSALDTPAGIEVSIISIDLNAFIIFIFLMGMYTVIYIGTIYVYFTRHPSKYHPVPAAITMLYLSSMAYTAFQWYSTIWQFVDNGSTRKSVFLAIVGVPGWLFIALNMSNCTTSVIADGLLIWRCFHAWNRSLRIISLPLVLIAMEFALYMVEISFYTRHINASAPVATTIDDVLSAAYFMSFSTTFVTTVLIAYRVYSSSKHQVASSKQFKHVIDIVVQSGAVYALAQLVAALSYVVPGSTTSNTANIAFQGYGVILSVAITGISPTVMVARVALLPPDNNYPSTSVHSSGLQFHTRSAQSTLDIEAIEINDSVYDGRISAREGHAIVQAGIVFSNSSPNTYLKSERRTF